MVVPMADPVPTVERKPPFAYFGGKTLLAERIADTFPPHGHYVEPFGGSLAVLLAKPPSPMETVNDLDGDLMRFWRVLRDRPADLARVCALTPHSRAEWESCADLEVHDELERARRVWTRLVQGRAGRLTRTGWRHYVNPTSSPSTAFPGYLDGYVNRMATAARRLHHVTLECRPALELIDRYGAHEGVLLYVDPPYLGSARGYGNAYRHEMRTSEEHRGLAEALHRCKAAVVLSGYASDLYDLELYPDWHRVTFATGTGQGPDGWSNRTEVLWSNRSPEPTLFDTTAGAG
jgi:DNA adenine methylase